jgi:hypothetical protein
MEKAPREMPYARSILELARTRLTIDDESPSVVEHSPVEISISPSFEDVVAEYKNTAEHNDQVFRLMTALTWREPCLSAHRHYIEENKLGFGDAAFHAMWLRLLENAYRRFGTVRALEIGVFKGQVISLWALIGKHWKLNVQISAISPLAGQPLPKSRLANLIRRGFDPRFREQLRNANFYADDDYAGIIKRLFERFAVDYDAVKMYQGYSTDRRILDLMAKSTFHVVYVDGDHTLKGALHDFKVFGTKVVSGGWLVADDASCALPGSAFWKGHEAVSHAAEILPTIGFRNILNVGHNRIYELAS